ncbi:MAG: ExbD/TolR family protein, partial [Thermodesulfobacteriota bacterium]
MAIGKFDEKSDDDIVAEINITPLTDIFLVLLIIFMITSSALVESGAKIDLPEVSKTEQVSRNVVVTLTSQHEIYVNQKLVSERNFGEELKRALEGSSDKVVILEGDK